MTSLEEILEKAQRARLIPTVADSRKEERLVSILLATLPTVRPLAEFLLERCGQRFAKSFDLQTYTEVKFPSMDGTGEDRPDGLLSLTTRKARWTALVEAKVENSEIEEDQINRYAEIAKKYQIDAVITFSNQLVPLPTHVPYVVGRKYKNYVHFFHFSWISILTQALLVLRNANEVSPEQAFVLREVAHYLEHPTSGVSQFKQMNSEWRGLVVGVRNGQQFKRTSSEIQNAVASWHQEERDVSLVLSRRIGEQVDIRGISRKHRADPGLRLREACDELTISNKLYSAFSVPNAASDIEVTADLKGRTISCSMKLGAPRDRKRASARINWLRRQLREVEDGNIQVRAFWPGRAVSTQASLAEVKADPSCLENDRRGMAPTGFEVVMIKDVAGRFSGRRTFIEDLEKLVPEFYEEIGQRLRPWTPPPPPIAKNDPIHEAGMEPKDEERDAGEAASSEDGHAHHSSHETDSGFS